MLLTCPEVDPATHDNFAIRKTAAHGHFKVVELLLTCLGEILQLMIICNWKAAANGNFELLGLFGYIL